MNTTFTRMIGRSLTGWSMLPEKSQKQQSRNLPHKIKGKVCENVNVNGQ
jgi:hypothetical protein